MVADRGGAGVKAGEQVAVDPGLARELDRRRASRCSHLRVSEPMRSRPCAAPWVRRRPVSSGPDAACGDARRNPRRSRGRLREPPSRCAGRRIEVSLMVTAKLWVFDLGLSVAVGGVGIGAAWWMRRFTLLSARNLYPGAAVGVLGIAVSALLGWRVGQLVLLPIAAPWVAAASVGHRWRQSDLGAGEELRAHAPVAMGAASAPASGRAAVSGLAGRARARATVA